MLQNIQIRNFALIDQAEIDFKAGFNVLTGETGAGKSIVIDAVNLVLGGRGSVEFIRSGEDKATVSALFDISGLNSLKTVLADMGIEALEDSLFISREISATGKNTCRINGQMTSLSIYKEISKYLIDIHGQHDHHSLLMPEKHLNLLDSFGGEELAGIRNEAAAVYGQLKENLNQMKMITGGERDRARQKDIFQYQLEEIDQAELQIDEDNNLEDEKKIVANAEKLANLSNQAYICLYKGNEGMSAVDQLNQAINYLKEISGIDSNTSSLLNIIQEATIQIEEASYDLRNYTEKIDFNPARLEELEVRLDLIKGLKRKYGDTIDEILKFRDEIAAELDLINSGDEKVAALENKISKLRQEFDAKALELTKKRRQLAGILEKEIARELKELMMPHVKFKVYFHENTKPTSLGRDHIEFLISPNPGEPLKPLSKIASGGELSRIMLALKAILARLDEIPTLIF